MRMGDNVRTLSTSSFHAAHAALRGGPFETILASTAGHVEAASRRKGEWAPILRRTVDAAVSQVSPGLVAGLARRATSLEWEGVVGLRRGVEHHREIGLDILSYDVSLCVAHVDAEARRCGVGGALLAFCHDMVASDLSVLADRMRDDPRRVRLDVRVHGEGASHEGLRLLQRFHDGVRDLATARSGPLRDPRVVSEIHDGASRRRAA